MNWIDFTAIGIITVSVLIGLVRGFVKEAISITSWAAAFFITNYFYSDVNGYFTLIKNPYYRSGAAVFCLLTAPFLMGRLCNYILSHLVKSAGLSKVDRVLGMCSGGLRGLFVVSAVLFLLSRTAFSGTMWWQQSYIIPKLTVNLQWFYDLVKSFSIFTITH